jgi:hypothetical protein
LNRQAWTYYPAPHLRANVSASWWLTKKGNSVSGAVEARKVRYIRGEPTGVQPEEERRHKGDKGASDDFSVHDSIFTTRRLPPG